MSSTEQTAFTVVGAVGGFFVGGPVGAVYGAALGYTLGMSTLNTSLPAVEGPRLSDLKVQANTYGWNIPSSHGTVGHNGALIWSSGIEEKKSTEQVEQGGKGSPPTQEYKTYTYSASFAVLFHDGEIKAVRRVYANEYLVYDAGDFSEYGSLDDFETADWITTKISGVGKNSGDLTIYRGTETQDPDPTIQSYEGADNVPGFRGFAYLVFDRLQLEKFGNRIPQIRIEYVATVDDPDTATSLIKTVDYSDDAVDNFYSSRVPTIDRDGIQHIFTLVGVDENDADGFDYYKGIPTGATTYQSFMPLIINPDRHILTGSCDLPMVFVQDLTTYIIHVGQPNGSIHESGEVVYFELAGDDFEFTNTGLTCCLAQTGNNVEGKIFYWGNLVEKFRVYNYRKYIEVSLIGQVSTEVDVWSYDFDVDAGVSNSGPHGFAVSENYLYMVYRDGTVRRYDHKGNLLDTFAPSPTQTLGGDKLGVQVDKDNEDIIYVHTGNTLFRVVSGAYESLGTGFGFTSQAQPYAVFTNMLVLPDTDDAEIRFYSLGDIARTAESLDVVVGNLLDSAGYDPSDYDVTALSGIEVSGFTRSSISAPSKSIELLMRAYQFSCYEDESKIIFNLRGSSVDKTIGTDDLGAGIDNASISIFKKERIDDQGLPLVVDVNYLDPHKEYDISTQSSRRSSIYDTKQVVSVDLPMSLSADEARQMAEKIHSAIWTARTSFKEVRVPLKYLDVTPTDVVDFVANEKYSRIRVTSLSIGEFIELGGIAENQEDFSSVIAGQQQPINYRGSGNAGVSEIYLINAPALRDSDGDAGFYFAAHGYSNAWRGCVLFAQGSSGGWNQVASATSPAVVGVAMSVLGSGISQVVDYESSVIVKMRSGDLFSSTLGNLLSDRSINAALIGSNGRWEVIQYLNADDNGNGSYTISGFIRGQNGTEYAMDAHELGDLFIALSPATITRAYSEEVDQSFLYRGVSIGSDFQSGTDFVFTNTAEAMKPFSPVHLTIVDNNDGTYEINCLRRARIMGEWRDYEDVPLVEQTERYRVSVYNGSDIFSTEIVTAMPATVEGVPGYVVRVAQLSDYYGPGHEVEGVLGGDLDPATYNPSDMGANISLSGGNLIATGTGGGWKSLRANTGLSFGKWYWEVTLNTLDSGVMIGVGKSSAGLGSYCGADANGWSYNWGGNIYHNGGATAYGATFNAGDIISVAVDMATGRVWFAKNGVWQNSGDPAAGTGYAFTGLTGPIFPQDSPFGLSKLTANYGNSALAYTPPTGFAAGVFG